MIGVDTNILVYSHRKDSPWHRKAYDIVRNLATGPARWALPWPCLHEFLAIVTHPKVYAPATRLGEALEQIQLWMDSPSVVLLAEQKGHWQMLQKLALAGHIQGPGIHDAKIASICLAHGVRQFWTADRDFGRFPQLNARNPLVE